MSESTWQQKIASIQDSYYLSTVYREVLASTRQSLAIYGSGLRNRIRICCVGWLY